MKILVICQYYYPEPFRVSDLCEELVRRGHTVHVVTGEPNYPEGKIYPGYERHQHAEEELRGVRVHRCPLIPRKTGAFFRLLNYFSYPLSAKRYLRGLPREEAESYDLVFVNQLSPVMMAQPAVYFHRRYGTPLALYCLDLWPVSLTAGGVGENSPLYRFFRLVSRKLYRAADRIMVTSRLFRSYLHEEFDIPLERISYLPQYAEVLFDNLEQKTENEGTKLLFAGNIGAAQSVETILRAAAILRSEPIEFQIAGGGTELEKLKGLAEQLGLKNVVFFGRRPLEEMPGLYAQADAMLVTLRSDKALSLTLPGKVQSYMAAGKPVIGAIDGETQEVIRAARCGFCARAEDAQALADCIRRFVDSNEKVEMGRRAREYYEAHFEKALFMDRLEEEMKETIRSSSVIL